MMKVISIKHIKKSMFIVMGLISFSIGVAGTILPVLPGGPFYLFAAFCFAKSSERLDKWFKSTEAYDKYVLAFREKRGMPLKRKIRINVIADFFIILSVIYVDNLIVRIILIAMGIYKHYYFIKKIKTIRPQAIDSNNG